MSVQARAAAAAPSGSALVAKQLAVNVFKDRLMQSGHVDLPKCLSKTSAQASSSTGDGSGSGGDSSRLHRVMMGLCRQVRKDYESLFEDMIEQLRPTPTTSYGQFLGFASELFQDGVTHGKIVSLYVFCGELVNYCMVHHTTLGPEFVASILGWHGRCFVEVVQQWLDEHGGWAKFEEVYGKSVSGVDNVADFSNVVDMPSPVLAKKRDKEEWRARMAGVALVALGIGYAFS